MLTLAEAKVGMTDKVDQEVIDEFRRDSMLLDKLEFDDSISPGTGGSTLGYSYIQLKTPSTAKTRKLNEEYKPGEAKREEKHSKAVIMGGSFELDRVLAETDGAVDELDFQTKEKIKATANEFHNMVINGDSSQGDGEEFDGLSKLLTGTESEYTSEIDISDSQKLDENYQALLDEVDAFISKLDGTPDVLLMNNDLLTKMRSAARRAGYYERTKTDFGKTVEKYGEIPMEDVGKYYDGEKTKDVISTSTEGKTDLYAVKIGRDGFHGISPKGDKVIKSYMPDLNAPGAVKKGEVELIAGVVLKNSKKAAVLRGITVKKNSSVSPVVDPEITKVTITNSSESYTTSTATEDTVVATIAVEGGTAPYSYALDGTDKDSFKIEETDIKAKTSLTEKTYNASVTVTDSKQKTKTQEFSITVSGE